MATINAHDFPALCGEVVTEGHAQLCRDRGHAVHTIDGVTAERCPRCGELSPLDVLAQVVAEMPADGPASPYAEMLARCELTKRARRGNAEYVRTMRERRWETC